MEITRSVTMSEADWHLVRAGCPQLIRSHRRATGESFQFFPLFRTHREAVHYCRQSGLWHQNIRPRHNCVASRQATNQLEGFRSLLSHATAEGVTVIGVFVGFNTAHESRWEYLRSPTEGEPRPLRLSAFELLPEDERPLDGV